MDCAGQRLLSVLVHGEIALRGHIHMCERKGTQSILAGVEEQSQLRKRQGHSSMQVGIEVAGWAGW